MKPDRQLRALLGAVGRTLRRAAYAGLAIGVVAFVVWSFRTVGPSPAGMIAQGHKGLKTILDFFPPDFTIWRKTLRSMLTTTEMAVVGTIMGAAGAVPLSFLAARTTSFVRGLSSVIKTLMNIFRATPIVVYAIILASVVGLGEQTGSLAIAVGTFVMLTKMYAEALESVAAGPVEAVRAAGGNPVQAFVFGMLPQVFPGFVAMTLYAFELNLQASFVLGFVGAGGVGFDILNYTAMFDWAKLCTVLIVTIIVVNLLDLISFKVRSAIS